MRRGDGIADNPDHRADPDHTRHDAPARQGSLPQWFHTRQCSVAALDPGKAQILVQARRNQEATDTFLRRVVEGQPGTSLRA
jgi:hypothetical protein